MKKIWEWIKNNPNRTMFLVPIILVAIISISHVVSWYDIANPITWAIYLSIAIEVGAMTALVAATNKIKGGVWFMFSIVTLIQMIGNIFFSFKEIDSNGELFKSWIELTNPVWEALGSDTNDVTSLKRWLAFLEGGLLPIISLTSLHFFIKYKPNEEQETIKEIIVEKEVPVEVIKEVVKEIPVTVEVEKIVEKEIPVEKIVEKVIEKEIPVEVIKEVIVEKPIYVEQKLTDEEIIQRFREIASEQNDDPTRKLIYTK
jgi:hypothetical protein